MVRLIPLAMATDTRSEQVMVRNQTMPTRRRRLGVEVLEDRLVPATVLTTLDTNGDGAVDRVLNEVSFIRIVHSDNSMKTYQLGTGWTFLTSTATNTDGDDKNAADLAFKLSNGIIRIIHDRTRKVSDYNLGPSPTLLTATTTNASAGTDLVFTVPQGLRIIDDNKKVVRKYNLNGPWQQLAGAPTNLDFDPQTEITYTVPGGIRVINDSSGTSTFYEIPGPWRLLTTGDFDGKTASVQNQTVATDLVFAVPAGLRIVHEANRTVSKYFSSTGFWNLVSLGTQDGAPSSTNTDKSLGNELVFDMGGGKIAVINDALRQVTQYTVGNNWSIITVANTDGAPGNELVFQVGTTVRIIRNASRTTATYGLGQAFTFLEAINLDPPDQPRPGLELRFQVGSRVIVISDETGKKFEQPPA
jgi:hypothetical protein